MYFKGIKLNREQVQNYCLIPSIVLLLFLPLFLKTNLGIISIITGIIYPLVFYIFINYSKNVYKKEVASIISNLNTNDMYVCSCEMFEDKSLKSFTGGFGSINFGSFSLGNFSIKEDSKKRTISRESLGKGTLEISKTKISFISDGTGQNWSQSLDKISKVSSMSNIFLVQPSNGSGKMFKTSVFKPSSDPDILKHFFDLKRV